MFIVVLCFDGLHRLLSLFPFFDRIIVVSLNLEKKSKRACVSMTFVISYLPSFKTFDRYKFSYVHSFIAFRWASSTLKLVSLFWQAYCGNILKKIQTVFRWNSSFRIYRVLLDLKRSYQVLWNFIIFFLKDSRYFTGFTLGFSKFDQVFLNLLDCCTDFGRVMERPVIKVVVSLKFKIGKRCRCTVVIWVVVVDGVLRSLSSYEVSGARRRRPIKVDRFFFFLFVPPSAFSFASGDGLRRRQQQMNWRRNERGRLWIDGRPHDSSSAKPEGEMNGPSPLLQDCPWAIGTRLRSTCARNSSLNVSFTVD